MLECITNNILNGKNLSRSDIDYLSAADINAITYAADKIRRQFCKNKFSLCSVINGKSGRCSENCKFCAQSKHHNTTIDEYDFLDSDTISNDFKKHCEAGVHRYSIVTAGKRLSEREVEYAASVYSRLHSQNPSAKLCASHGLLTYEQLVKLKNSGVTRYHCNLETSESYFPKICTTHTYAEKIETINNAKKAGLTVCSGGIIGMGESMNDRIDLALALSDLNVDSIPINILSPIKNTPLESCPPLSLDEILRTVAIFRFINPKAEIRIAAGRKNIPQNGLAAFLGGANAAITGDMLTTTGSTTAEDIEMLKNNGFDV